MTDIEGFKNLIADMERSLTNPRLEDGEIIRIKKDISDTKDMLIKKYNDITYATAMNFNDYERWIKQQGKQKSHKTGIDFIDQIFGGDGIHEETFVNIIGDSGTGKSTLAIQILLNIAEHSKSYFISLEMGRFKTYNKINSMIKTQKQRENLFIDIWNDDLSNIERDIELFARNGAKVFVIDSKMKILVNGAEKEHEKISKLSNSLSKLTQKLGIIIFLINQISEENIKTGRATMKGSGDQKYDSDLIFQIERSKKNDKSRIFHLAKNRQNDIEPKIEYFADFRTYEVEGGTVDMPLEL